MPIDTLKEKRRLVEEYGFNEREAEGIARLVARANERGAARADRKATRAKLEAMETRLKLHLTERIVWAASAAVIFSLLSFLLV